MGEKVEEEKQAEEVGVTEEKAAAVPEKEEKPAPESEEKAQEKSKDEGGEKKEDGGEKKEAEEKVAEKTEESPINEVVLKMDLHCEGCARKVRRAISNFEGVTKVETDFEKNEVIVTGDVDPESLRERVAFRTRKEVVLISPVPVKAAGGEKVEEKKTEEKPAEKPTEPVITTSVLIMRLHCQGCARKIKKIIKKNFSDVQTVNTDLEKNSITVTGTADINEVASFLDDKLKRSVGILPPPKKADDAGGEENGEAKKEETGDSGGDKKAEEEKADDGSDGEDDDDVGGKVEISKMAYSGYNPYTYHAFPMYNPSYVATAMQYAPPPTYVQYDRSYFVHDHYPVQGYTNPGYGYGYVNHGYANQGYVSHGYVNRGYGQEMMTYGDRMFSDENPNGCFIM